MSLTDLPLRRRRKEARPQELLDAALELFVEKGFAAARAEEVAIRAGVSKGTLYLYYPSKEDLLKAVIKKNLSERLAAGAAQAADFEGSATELIRSLLVDWWTQIYDDPASAVFKLIITEARTFPEIAEFYAREVIVSTSTPSAPAARRRRCSKARPSSGSTSTWCWRAWPPRHLPRPCATWPRNRIRALPASRTPAP
jgi:AcrR family transcriptional regulator